MAALRHFRVAASSLAVATMVAAFAFPSTSDAAVRACLVDSLVQLYPDSDGRDGAEAMELDVARGGTAAVHVLLNDLPKGAAVVFAVEEGGRAVKQAEWFRLIDVPVEQNTGPGAFTEKPGQKNPHVTRRAPFRVYDAMAPVDPPLESPGGTLALRLHVPIPMGAAPARRELAIRIRAGEVEKVLALAVNVHKVAIPPVGRESLSYTNWYSLHNMAARHGLKPWREEHWAMIGRYAALMVRARQNTFWITWGDVFSRGQDGLVLDRERLARLVDVFTKAGMHWIEGGHVAGRQKGQWTAKRFENVLTATLSTSEAGEAELANALGQLRQEIELRGWQDQWLQHVADEPIAENVEDYKKVAAIVRKHLPGVPIVDATMNTELAGAINVWCPQVQEYQKHRDRFAAWQEAGDRVWVYTCCSPGGPWLNRLLDEELLRPALLGWAIARFDIQGFLHWGLNHYQGDQDPFQKSVVPAGGAGGESFLPAGDTHVVYPGKDGPWSSLRLEAQREGFEDCELLRKLKAARPEKARQIIQGVLRGFDDYTKDVKAFRAARRELLAAADDMGTGSAESSTPCLSPSQPEQARAPETATGASAKTGRSQSPVPGQPVDVAPFGQVMRWDDGGKDYGVMWEDARDIFRVAVTFADPAAAPKPDAVRLEYWQSSWPEHRIPRDRPSGSGGSGWLNVGDWFQGQWRRADAKVQADGPALTFTFRPINAAEFPNLADFPAEYRSTLKLRVISDSPLPKIASFQAYTDSVWRKLDLEIEWGGGGTGKMSVIPGPTGETPLPPGEMVWDGRLEAFNGHVLSIRPLTADTTLVESGAAAGPGSGPAGRPSQPWRSRIKGPTSGVAASVLRAEPKAVSSFDETVFTLRAEEGDRTFSFAASDLARDGRIFLPDFGALIRLAGDSTTYAAAEEAWRKAAAEPKTMSLYDRVLTMPEQTFQRAWGDTPPKGRHYIPLCWEGCSRHFGLDERGAAWTDGGMRYEFGLPDSPLTDRRRVDGHLPMMVNEWADGGVRYRQTAFAVPLKGVPPPGEAIGAEDMLILMVRIEMELADGGPAEAKLDLGYRTDRTWQRMALKGDLGVDPAEKPRFSPIFIRPAEPAGKWSLAEDGKTGRVAYRAKLAGDDGRRVLDLAVPHRPPAEGTDEARIWDLRSENLRFEKAYSAAAGYWRARIAAGTQIITPEPMINDFYKAHITHLLVNTEREKGGADRYMARVGTFHYGVFPNESCMMISDLDRRGYHKPAERALETWLHYQGTVGLPGDFSTRDGQLYGAGGYEMGGYNQSHGWILWCLGEHFWYTRDAAWLKRVAPKVVLGCDWIIGQRRRMIDEARRNPLRRIESGLLPCGNLEDIRDWRCWLSTNVYTWWGLDNASRALEAIGHADAPRLRQEAQAYHGDLIAAATEAMRRSPVVRLRDGRWVPHVPSEFHRRGRSFGWITETLEGAVHLLIARAVQPDSRLGTWILQDYEDNLFISEQYGYALAGEGFERRWFSHGGISQQANLLLAPLAYLWRDQAPHFLRGYFNAFAVSFFADTRMMTEHALPNIGDWRGDHFKSSDEANSTYWLRLMFVQERGDELWLGSAIPRYWLADGKVIGITNARTHFGPMSMELVSAAASGRIEMTIDPPRRNPPRIIRARVRHPQSLPMIRCEVNGKEWKDFYPKKEWVVLDGKAAAAEPGPIRVMASYR